MAPHLFPVDDGLSCPLYGYWAHGLRHGAWVSPISAHSALHRRLSVEQVTEQLSRDPLPYPTLELRQADSIFDYQYEDIQIVGYQHHPAIKAPVAV